MPRDCKFRAVNVRVPRTHHEELKTLPREEQWNFIFFSCICLMQALFYRNRSRNHITVINYCTGTECTLVPSCKYRRKDNSVNGDTICVIGSVGVRWKRMTLFGMSVWCSLLPNFTRVTKKLLTRELRLIQSSMLSIPTKDICGW